MGYNPNKKVVERFKAQLDFMLQMEGDFKLPSDDPRTLAYEIRRAVKAIEAYPRSFPEYQSLVKKFVLKERDGHILFSRRAQLVTGTPIPVTPEGLATSRSLSIEDVSSTLQIIGAAIKHKAETLEFPDAQPTDEQLQQILKWTKANGYYISLHPVFTLSKIKPVNEWQPDPKSL